MHQNHEIHPKEHREKVKDQHGGILEHHHTLKEELLCHLPYAIFSVAFSMIILSFLTNTGLDHNAFHQLFHNFHFLHILFAGTGAVLVFRKYSQNIPAALAVGVAVPAVFCTLSDALLPYIGGVYIGLDMHFHWCFISHLDKIIPFLAVGILNGFVMAGHHSSRQLLYSAGSHFVHIFISSMAAMLYLVSFGFDDWHNQIGFVFLYLIVAVLIPCTLSDVVVPMIFANSRFSKESK